MKRKRIAQMTVILIIAFIPALYAIIYLCAYWDPARYLPDISVAVVNNDKGAEINGQNESIGGTLVESLKANADVKWVFTDKQDADNGVLQEKYYAELVIPEDFTRCIATVSDLNKTQGRLYFRSNDKLGTTASSMMTGVSAHIESTVTDSIAENLADALAGKLQQLPDSLQQLSDGLSRLDDGAAQLGAGVTALTQGQSAFNTGLNKLTAGLKDAGHGSQDMDSALHLLSDKSTQFASAIRDNASILQTLANYSSQYGSGLTELSGKLNTYINSSSKELSESIAIMACLSAYIAEHPESAADSNMHQIITALNSINGSAGAAADPAAAASALTAALSKMTQSYAQLNTALQKLPGTIQTALSGAGALAGGVGQISGGAELLASGINTLSQGAETLNEKSQLLLSSDQEVQSGISQLGSGIEQIKASVDSSLQLLKNGSSGLQGFGEFAVHPVMMETEKVGEARNTGTAMAPFMLSLCLWLGGLMFVIIFTTMDKVKFDELKSSQKTMIDFGLFRFQLIAAIQAAFLAFAVLTLLGLQVGNAVQFYGICILGSVTFITVIQVLVLVFRDLGKLLSIIFLLLQITAGGGMLSKDLIPPFYKAINPYMPMTYTIDAFRNSIQGMDAGDYSRSVTVLVVTLTAGVALVALLSLLSHLSGRSKGKKAAADLTAGLAD